MALVIVLFMVLAGCDARWHVHHDQPDQSWDQEHLKRFDNSCRTMVYHVDPDTGELVQCPPDSL